VVTDLRAALQNEQPGKRGRTEQLLKDIDQLTQERGRLNDELNQMKRQVGTSSKELSQLNRELDKLGNDLQRQECLIGDLCSRETGIVKENEELKSRPRTEVEERANEIKRMDTEKSHLFQQIRAFGL
jgi:archaellum component FlaC